MASYPFETDCVRNGCEHPSSRHSIDDRQNLGPCDPGVKFRCQECDCPEMVRSVQNLSDLVALS